MTRCVVSSFVPLSMCKIRRGSRLHGINFFAHGFRGGGRGSFSSTENHRVPHSLSGSVFPLRLPPLSARAVSLVLTESFSYAAAATKNGSRRRPRAAIGRCEASGSHDSRRRLSLGRRRRRRSLAVHPHQAEVVRHPCHRRGWGGHRRRRGLDGRDRVWAGPAADAVRVFLFAEMQPTNDDQDDEDDNSASKKRRNVRVPSPWRGIVCALFTLVAYCRTWRAQSRRKIESQLRDFARVARTKSKPRLAKKTQQRRRRQGSAALSFFLVLDCVASKTEIAVS